MAKESKLTVTGLTTEQKIQQWLDKHTFTTGGTIDDYVRKDVSGATKSIVKKGKTKTSSPEFSFSSWTGSNRTTTFKSRSKLVKSETPLVFSAHTNMSKITKGVKQQPVAKSKSVSSRSTNGYTPTKKGVKPQVKTTLESLVNNLNFTAGTIDTTFPYGSNTGFDGIVYSCKLQSDGKILVGGDFTYYNFNGDSYYSPYFTRLNSDGSPDFDFEYTFLAWNDGDYVNGDVYTIDIQSDGKILIGGDFDYYYENTNWYSPRIMRFNSDGTFDDTFFVGDGFNDTVRKIIVQPDGNILAAGDFTSYNNSQYNPNNGRAYWRIIRLQTNGYPDLTFNPGFGIDWDDYGSIFAMVLQPDGKIILGGDFYNYNGTNVNYIVRLNSDASYDNTFIQGDGFNDIVYSLALQSNGKIIVGGNFNYYNNIDLFSGYIVRLTSNGMLDTKFGFGLDGIVYSLAVQSDDKILVGFDGGQFYPDNFTTINADELIRFHSNCTFDFAFYYEELFNGPPYAICLTSDNKIFVGGSFNNNGDATVYPLNYFGKLNNAIVGYEYYYKVIDIIQNYDPLTDVYYIVGSNEPLEVDSVITFTSLENPSFTYGGIVTDEYPSMDVQYVFSKFYGVPYDEPSYENLITEVVNENFKTALVNNCIGYFGSIPVLVSKNYKVGDFFYLNRGLDEGDGVQILTPTQIIEFVPFDYFTILPVSPIEYIPYNSCEETIRANGIPYIVQDCIDQTNYYHVLGKEYIDYNKILYLPLGDVSNCNFIFEYLSYMPFSAYTAGTYTILESSQQFDNCDECLSKTNSGQFDVDFYMNNSNNDMVYTMVEQPDGKIIIGGNFWNYDGSGKDYIVRLNEDGTVDTDFNNGGNGFDEKVNAIALLPDGKILVGGNFSYYNDGAQTYFCDYLARLNPDGTFDTTFYLSNPDDYVRSIAVQLDGKFVIGGNFGYVDGDYHSGFARLNSDGTVDTTLNTGNGFNNGVYKIVLSEMYEAPFYTPGDKTYTCQYIIGGWFTYYDNIEARGIIKLNQDGSVLSTFGSGFNYNFGPNPRVNDIVVQPDGKLIIVGGANNGGVLLEYQGIEIPVNIVRLNTDESIDRTFNTLPFFDGGGFDGYIVSATLQKNGKIILGGSFDAYGDVTNPSGYEVYDLIRLNTDGTYDSTFKLANDFYNQINKVYIDSKGRLLIGYWNDYFDWSLISRIYIGEEFTLREFITCDGVTANLILPSTFNNNSATEIQYRPMSMEGLSEMPIPGDRDEDYIEIPFPSGFTCNFLGQDYDRVYMATNSYITFGGGEINYDFDIPTEIPGIIGLPGIYLSTNNGSNSSSGMDDYLFNWYSGITNYGETFVIRYEGTYYTFKDLVTPPALIYNFVFYKNDPHRIDLVIDSNNYFFYNNPTGGVSDGVTPTWVTSFSSDSARAYRIQTGLSAVVKANITDKEIECGNYGGKLTSVVGSSSAGGSMYFDGNNGTIVEVDNSGGQFGFGGTFDFTIEWFQYWENGSNSRPFSIGVYDNPSEMIGMSFEGTVYLWIGNSAHNTNITNSDIVNGWHHIAITRFYDGADHIWRVFLDGILKLELTDNTDTSNTYSLTLGNQLNNDGLFQGYITNFRVNNQTALYVSNFTVPTSALQNIPNTILLMLATDSANLITDSSNNQTITSNGVVWSSNSPLSSTPVVYTYTGGSIYDICTQCNSDFRYETLLYVRDGVNPDYVQRARLTADAINKIQTMGPIFTTLGIECYELLDYWK